MEKFAVEIFGRFGVLRPLFFVTIGAAVVWGLGHFVATPGTSVKVLWGLIEYTKSSDITVDRREVREVLSTENKDANEFNVNEHLLKIDLKLTHGLRPEDYKEKIKDFRSKFSLRPLRALEGGVLLSETPPSTFSFMPGVYFERKKEDHLSIDKMAKVESKNLYESMMFEIHHRDDGIYILCYANELDALRVSVLDGKREHRVVCSPSPWDGFSSLIFLPVNRIEVARAREIQTEQDGRLQIVDAVIR